MNESASGLEASTPAGASSKGPRIPIATYRLQLRSEFTFDDARARLQYLADLGISDVYLSPITQAASGSTHGYDVIDATRISEELGGESAFRALVEEAGRLGLGVVLDIVPNHMGIAEGQNLWWEDVLRLGRESPHARVFDIDWDVPDPQIRGRVLLPILGDTPEGVLERGELELVPGDAAAPEGYVRYYERRLPLAPGTLATVLGEGAGAGSAATAIEAFNARRTTPEGRSQLEMLLERQHYRLEYWLTGKPRINYRRFFEIDTLAGVRQEDPEVFALTHELVLRLVREGAVTGLRIDHPDGLADPEAYLAQLAAATGGNVEHGAPSARVYDVIEKILALDEPLRETWATHGTTGYDFLNEVNGAFVAREHADRLTATYRAFTARNASYADIAYVTRREVIGGPLEGQFAWLIARLHEALAGSDAGALPRATFSEALRTLVASMPVYRTYHTARALDPMAPALLASTSRQAAANNPALDTRDLETVAGVLGAPPEGAGGGVRRLVMRLQQLMPAVQAKGLEDTAFYRYLRLLSLNAVGGEPDRFGSSIEEFHQRNLDRRVRWPASMLTTATHDHKRGEDARARLNVLSELPDEWAAALERWSALTSGLRRGVGQDGPDRRDEYLLYQTVLATWPPGLATAEVAEALGERVKSYILKAAREAGQRTDWMRPNESYEAHLEAFVDGLLDRRTGSAFLEDALPLQRGVARLGAINSLAQLLLRLTSPGVPDTYQGTELWDLSLVDPDNRRPVDFEARAATLRRLRPTLERTPEGEALRSMLASELLDAWTDGVVKMYVLAAALERRGALHPLFLDGDYVPLRVGGRRALHVIAFARVLGDRGAVTVVPRLPAALLSERDTGPLWTPDWGDTVLELPASLLAAPLTDAFTAARLSPSPEGRLPLAAVLGRFPVALLEVGAASG